MDTRKIRKLIELVKETGIGELEVKSGEDSVRISCHTSAMPSHSQQISAPNAAPVTAFVANEIVAPVAKHALPEGHHVKSPMVGTVYLSGTPGNPPFVNIGQKVKIGDTLCLIEAMKMFNKIEADATGTISARLIENGQQVEYDQPLFIIDIN